MEEQEDKNTNLSKESPHKKGHGIVGKIFKGILVLIGLYILCSVFIALPHKISGDSMSPYLKNGEYVWSEKISYHLHSPRRDDVVFVNSPSSPSELVARIIGLPGETVSVRPGEIKINGKVLDETHINWGSLSPESNTWPSGEIILKPNQYLGIGDNQIFTSSGNENITKEAIQNWLETSTFSLQEITGKASSITY